MGLIPTNGIISEDRVKHTVDFLTVQESELLKVNLKCRNHHPILNRPI